MLLCPYPPPGVKKFKNTLLLSRGVCVILMYGIRLQRFTPDNCFPCEPYDAEPFCMDIVYPIYAARNTPDRGNALYFPFPFPGTRRLVPTNRGALSLQDARQGSTEVRNRVTPDENRTANSLPRVEIPVSWHSGVEIRLYCG